MTAHEVTSDLITKVSDAQCEEALDSLRDVIGQMALHMRGEKMADADKAAKLRQRWMRCYRYFNYIVEEFTDCI